MMRKRRHREPQREREIQGYRTQSKTQKYRPQRSRSLYMCKSDYDARSIYIWPVIKNEDPPPPSTQKTSADRRCGHRLYLSLQTHIQNIQREDEKSSEEEGRGVSKKRRQTKTSVIGERKSVYISDLQFDAPYRKGGYYCGEVIYTVGLYIFGQEKLGREYMSFTGIYSYVYISSLLYSTTTAGLLFFLTLELDQGVVR